MVADGDYLSAGWNLGLPALCTSAKNAFRHGTMRVG
jgi:hypothetical protein